MARGVRSDIPYKDRLLLEKYRTVKGHRDDAARWHDRCVLNIGTAFYDISHLFQLREKGLVCKSTAEGHINILTDQSPDSLLAGLLCVPLGVGFTTPGWLDHRQTVGFADRIGDLTNISIVIPKAVPVFLPIQKGHLVEQNMAVQVLLIQMGGDNGLIPIAK